MSVESSAILARNNGDVTIQCLSTEDRRGPLCYHIPCKLTQLRMKSVNCVRLLVENEIIQYQAIDEQMSNISSFKDYWRVFFLSS